MAAIIYNAYLYSPKLSSQLRSTTFNNQSFNHTKWSHYNLQQFTGVIACKSSSSKLNAGSGGGGSDYDATEESRWLREEQRWLREEQRWLREEARWNAERNSLLLQIQHLQAQLERLRRVRNGDSVKLDANFVVDDDDDDSQTLMKMTALLKGLRNDNSISEKKSKRIADFVVAAAADDDDDSAQISIELPDSLKSSRNDSDSSGVSVNDSKQVADNTADAPVSATESKSTDKVKDKKKKSSSWSSSLRMGAEGDEVRILQEALMSLGFYSGEEDMEYSSFSEGTARAVKTWQASIGIREDGVMTAELLERLYASHELQSSESSIKDHIRKIDEANGAVAKVGEVQQTAAKKEPSIVDVPHDRVFLLGENRWEEPSRLTKTKGNTQISGTRCITCKGEGRLLCMECDGTGEPNVEEQFLDWVEEGAKCPYCEGVGFSVCDVCHGKSVL